MHFAYVCADRGVPIGGTKGASIHVRGVVEGLRRRGHRVTVLAARKDPSAPDDVIDVGYDPTLKSLRVEMATAGGAPEAARELHAALSSVLVERELTRLHDREPVDVVYERHSLWSWAARSWTRKQGLRYLLEVNAPLCAEQEKYRTLQHRELAGAIERVQWNEADTVFVPSSELLREIVKVGRKRKTLVVPNAVDAELFRSPPPLREEFARSLKGRFTIVFVGSLKPWHGLDLLLEAFEEVVEKLPKAHLLILGEGPERPRVDQALQRWGPERVTAVGAVPHSEIPSWLAHGDVGVASYPDSEEFYFSPLKIVEYQASGLAVVASRIGHIQEQVNHGETGWLVDAGDAKALSSALLKLGEDRVLRKRLGKQARKFVLRERTWDQVARLVESSARGRKLRSAPQEEAVS